jgi:ribonuclease R
VRVQVSRVDLDGRKIDFRMVRDTQEDAALIRARRERLVGRSASAVEELAAVKETDRAVKASAKGKGRNGSGKTAHPVRAANASARKSSGKSARRR